jgi:hypothetical protein
MPRLVAKDLSEDDFRRLVALGDQNVDQSQASSQRQINHRAKSVPTSLLVITGLFVALFSAFLVMQSLLTSVLQSSDGYTALAVLYAAFFVFTNIAPVIIQQLGLKLSLVASAFSYTILHVTVALVAASSGEESSFGSNARAPSWIIFFGACVCGLGEEVTHSNTKLSGFHTEADHVHVDIIFCSIFCLNQNQVRQCCGRSKERTWSRSHSKAEQSCCFP